MAAPDHPTRSILDPTSHTTDGSRPSTQTPPTQRYLLANEIARGGMGVIYRATDTVLGREIAVKVLLEKYAPDSGTAARFAGDAWPFAKS
jgi:eukaryotic-like serine/threonine-protein kinase